MNGCLDHVGVMVVGLRRKSCTSCKILLPNAYANSIVIYSVCWLLEEVLATCEGKLSGATVTKGKIDGHLNAYMCLLRLLFIMQIAQKLIGCCVQPNYNIR